MSISQAILQEKASSFKSEMDFSEVLAMKKKAFLCYSHLDQDLVKGLISIFQEAGINILINWKDLPLPEKPDEKTAKKIQEKIDSSHIFLFLATKNSMASLWSSWEIGYADAKSRNIYIIPTTDTYGTYGDEYSLVYSSIDSGTLKESGKQVLGVCEASQNMGYLISNSTLV